MRMNTELHPHEVKILKELKQRSTPEEIAKKVDLPLGAIMRASSWLSTKDLIKIEEKITEEISLDKEGSIYAEKGLPERQLMELIKNGGDISNLENKLSKDNLTIGLGWIRKKNLGSFEKGKIKILKKEKTTDEKLLEILKKKERIDSEELDEDLKKGLDLLKKRKNVIKVSEKKRIWLLPTEKGLEIGKSTKVEAISQLTPEILISKEWKNMKFRHYDINIYIKPEFPAKRHPLQRLIEKIRDIFSEMGFKEITGPLVESTFWNFDALFVAQDHPARDMHDTFYLKNPQKIPIPEFEKFKLRVKRTHEDGWTTGSTGWGYEWNDKVARKPILRTHTTAVTGRYLTKLERKDLPANVFCIGKTFRNESVDYKHLPEFYQVEGIIVDENVNFRNLLGILKEFYDNMGSKVRFRPAYFPYTEMSVEPEVFLEEKGEWIELGGAGIFRPEVVKPLLGFDCPVLAWGLGLDRVVALNLGLNDIRELYISDLDWLRKSKLV